MNIPLTNITIPVFNRYDMTLETIESLLKNTNAPIVLTVVDNGSEKTLRQELYKLHKNGKIQNLFLLDDNYGISCACNIGWKSVNSPFFMKLDNDIKVLSPTWLSDVYSMWGNSRYKTIFGPIWNGQEPIGRNETPFGTFWNMPVSFAGAAFLVSAKVRDTVGYFCEDYGLYGEEDADYCLRCHHARIRKYAFEASGMLLHMGNDAATYTSHGINKKELHGNNVGKDGRGGIFALNLFLYEHGLRELNVPLKYEVASCTDCHVTLRERSEYASWYDKLLRCIEIHREITSTDDAIKEIRQILQ